MEIEDYLPALEDEIGEITEVTEWAPGIFFIAARTGTSLEAEYFAVLDTSPTAAKVRSYGKKIGGLRLFAQADDTSGFWIVQYESGKYNITVNKKPFPEYMFRDITLHAAEHHPEYFGAFPVPFHTPHGYTLLHRTLSNGIYWLETSECKELLTVCFPIWNAELSPAAVSAAEVLKVEGRGNPKESTCYLFFSKEESCVPIYELMETRKEWEGKVIDRPALMNAIWKYHPKYALHLNGQKDIKTREYAPDITAFWEKRGIQPFPDPHPDRIVRMYPDTGTDFLILQ